MSPATARALAGQLPVVDLTGLIRVKRTCTNLSCSDEATAEVLVGAMYKPKCFTHEREYADRFGPTDIRALS